MAKFFKHIVRSVVSIVLAISLVGCGGSSGGVRNALAERVTDSYDSENSADYVEALIELDQLDHEASLAVIQSASDASSDIREFKSRAIRGIEILMKESYNPETAPDLDDEWIARVIREQPELCNRRRRIKAIHKRAAEDAFLEAITIVGDRAMSSRGR